MKKLSILLLYFLSVAVFAQSPWTQKKQATYVQVSFTTIPSYSTLFGNPEYQTEREITDNTLQVYSEYGISNKTTLITTIPLKMVSSGDLSNPSLFPSTNKESQTSLGNIQFGIKHNFYQKKWLLSGQLLVEANTSNYDDDSGLRSGYDAWTFTPTLSLGRGFSSWYIQAFGGIDLRTNSYSSNLKLGGEIGYKAFEGLWVAGFLDGLASLQNGKRIDPENNKRTGLYVNNQSYAAFGMKLIGEFSSDFGINAGFGGAFDGRNVAKSPALSLGLFYKL